MRWLGMGERDQSICSSCADDRDFELAMESHGYRTLAQYIMHHKVRKNIKSALDEPIYGKPEVFKCYACQQFGMGNNMVATINGTYCQKCMLKS